MHRLILALSFVLASCGGDDDPAVIDATPPVPDASGPTCGDPSQAGNELGIGKYCDTSGDCAGTADAPFCATIAEPGAHFCTNICDEGGAPDQCGTAASCQCQGGTCGCTPDFCLE